MPIDMSRLATIKPTRNKKGNVVRTSQPNRSNWRHKAITALPLILVNLVAVYGQMAWAKEHINQWGLFGQIIFAFALESVAIAISYHSLLAELANDSALKLKLASYGFGLIVGILNYSHWAKPGFKPTATAIVVGMFSFLSPWLWNMYSRRVSRNTLKLNNLIEDHSIRLGSARWVYHPLKCFVVMSKATWNGTKIPSEAIAEYNNEREQTKLRNELENVSVNGTKERAEMS